MKISLCWSGLTKIIRSGLHCQVEADCLHQVVLQCFKCQPDAWQKMPNLTETEHLTLLKKNTRAVLTHILHQTCLERVPKFSKHLIRKPVSISAVVSKPPQPCAHAHICIQMLELCDCRLAAFMSCTVEPIWANRPWWAQEHTWIEV